MRGKMLQALKLFIILLLFYSCSLFEHEDNGTKSPRDFKWTVDTLAYPGEIQTVMSNLWGTASLFVNTVGCCIFLMDSLLHK